MITYLFDVEIENIIYTKKINFNELDKK